MSDFAASFARGQQGGNGQSIVNLISAIRDAQLQQERLAETKRSNLERERLAALTGQRAQQTIDLQQLRFDLENRPPARGDIGTSVGPRGRLTFDPGEDPTKPFGTLRQVTEPLPPEGRIAIPEKEFMEREGGLFAEREERAAVEAKAATAVTQRTSQAADRRFAILKTDTTNLLREKRASEQGDETFTVLGINPDGSVFNEIRQVRWPGVGGRKENLLNKNLQAGRDEFQVDFSDPTQQSFDATGPEQPLGGQPTEKPLSEQTTEDLINQLK